MKKVLFIAVMALVGLGNVNAQGSNFGIIADFQNLSLRWVLEV